MHFVCTIIADCCFLESCQVVERIIEVEPDKAALVEQLRAQMKAEVEAQQQQQLDEQALEEARQQAEARARQQLEVSTAVCVAVSLHQQVVFPNSHCVLWAP